MVGWHHQLNGHGFEWALGVSDGQGGQACCSSWDRKELDITFSDVGAKYDYALWDTPK